MIMKNKGHFLIGFAFFAVWALAPLWAQSHGSVAVEEEVYYILELAQMRGLCDPLPGVRPYSKRQVLYAL
ncbi:MAG: hypothetical protein LBB77_02660, partial [Treponema sp.]|nr:hypothetical protein [Treponema sp.]